MASYINVIEIILLCLTIYLAQIVKAPIQEFYKCCVKMDEYCSNEPPIDDYDIDSVNSGLLPSTALWLRWQYLTVDDCAKNEILKWKSDPEEPNDDARFNNGYMLIYRNQILSQMAYEEFSTPLQFCQSQGFADLVAFGECVNMFHRSFGASLDVIHIYAIQKTSIPDLQFDDEQNLVNVQPSLQMEYLKEIADFTFVDVTSGTLNPFQYCQHVNQDAQMFINVNKSEGPPLSESTSFSGSHGSSVNNRNLTRRLSRSASSASSAANSLRRNESGSSRRRSRYFPTE